MLSRAMSSSGKAWPACGNHIALVVLHRSLDDREAALHDLRLGGFELVAGRVGDGRAERRHLDEAVGQAAAHEVVDRAAVENGLVTKPV